MRLIHGAHLSRSEGLPLRLISVVGSCIVGACRIHIRSPGLHRLGQLSGWVHSGRRACSFLGAAGASAGHVNPNTQATSIYFGLRNWQGPLEHDQVFRTAVRNTLVMVGGALRTRAHDRRALASGTGGLRVGLLPFIGLFLAPRTSSPAAISQVVAGLVFLWLFDQNFGLVNYFLSFVDLGPYPWQDDARYLLLSLTLAAAWLTASYNLPIFAAALRNVPGTRLEAAALDGAGDVALFLHITLPAVRPVTFFVLISSAAAISQMLGLYDSLGQDSLASTILVKYMFVRAFSYNDLDYAGAIGCLMVTGLSLLAVPRLLLAEWREGAMIGAIAASDQLMRRFTSHGSPAGLLVVLFGPIFWMVSQSLKNMNQIITRPYDLFPLPVHPGRVWQRLAGGRLRGHLAWPATFLNTLIYAGVSTVANLLLGVPAGYAFARLRFPLRRVLFSLVLVSMMVPTAAIIIPLFMVVRVVSFDAPAPAAGSIPTRRLILPTAVTGLAIVLLRQYVRGIPRELDEAAVIDGCGAYRTLFYVILPLAGPGLASVAIASFLTRWDDYMWPAVVSVTPDMFTLQVGLRFIETNYAQEWPLLMASCTLTALPIVLLYIALQPLFDRGLAALGTGWE